MPVPTAGIRATEAQRKTDLTADDIELMKSAGLEVPTDAAPTDALTDDDIELMKSAGLEPPPRAMTPASPDAQIYRGSKPFELPPSDQQITGKLFDVYQEVADAERKSGRQDTADATAMAFLNGLRQVPAADTKTALAGRIANAAGIPVEGSNPVEWAANAAVRATEPGTGLGRLAESAAPRWFSSDAAGVQDTLGWRIAESQGERERAMSLRVARDIAAGIPADVAKKNARERLNDGSVLLLPTASNPDTAGMQADAPIEVVPLPKGAKEIATDIGAGLLRGAADLGNLAISGAETFAVPLYPAQRFAEVMGADDTAASIAEFRKKRLDDPVDALIKYANSFPENEQTPELRRLVARLEDGGVLTGMLGAVDEYTPLDIDPEGDGILNLAARTLVGKNKQAMEDVSIDDVTARTKAAADKALTTYGSAANTAYSAVTGGGATAADVGTAALDVGRDVLAVPKEALTTGFGSLSTTPEGRESTLGWWMRVGGSALQGIPTTYAARVLDKTLTSMGAESYRKHRTPWENQRTGGGYAHDVARKMHLGETGHEVADWVETLVPILDDGSFVQDYATTVWNGDSIMSETMRALDTLALGSPESWFSPETRASMRPGGRIYDYAVDLAMAGDLFLPLDGLAPSAVREPAVRMSRFADGYATGRYLGMPMKEAGVAGLAHSIPSIADRVLRNDPEYIAAHERLSGQVDRPAAPGAVVPGRDTDAPAVLSAHIASWAKRTREAGGDPVGAMRKSKNPAVRALADRVAEHFTTLAVEQTPRERPALLPTEDAEAPSPIATEPVIADKTRRAARPNIVSEAESAFIAADKDGAKPLGRWSPDIERIEDIDAQTGARLGELARHWGVSLDTARAALQAAMSYVDPKTERFVRAEWIDEDGLAKTTQRWRQYGLARLKNASPAQVFRNVLAFENGEVPVWSNEVSPARQRAVDALYGMVDRGETAFTKDNVTDYLTVADRMAAALVHHGVLPDTEAFWSSKRYSGIPEGEAAGEHVGGWIDLKKDGESLIVLSQTADLSTLFHEDAHLLRSMIPADQMAAVDAHVQATFGAWDVKAEEWFARQMESVLATGQMDIPDSQRAANPSLYRRLTEALRSAAKVLTEILRGREMEPLHPTVDKWVRDYFFATERVRPRETVDATPRSERKVRRGDRGLTPDRVNTFFEFQEQLVNEESGASRRKTIHKLVNDVAYWTGMSKEARKALHDRITPDGDLGVLVDLADIVNGARKETAAPVLPGATGFKDATHPTKRELVTAGFKATKDKPGLYTHPDRPEQYAWSYESKVFLPVSPEVPAGVKAPIEPIVAPTPEIPKAPEPPAEPPVTVSRAIDAKAKSTIESAENGALGQTKRRAMATLSAVVAEKMKAAGKQVAVTDAVVREVLGAATVNDYMQAITRAYRDYPASKAGLEPARIAAVSKATESALVRAGALDPFASTPDPVPPPAALDLVASTITPEEAQAAGEAATRPPLSASGNATHNTRGKRRTQVDGVGNVVEVTVHRMPVDDIVLSHTTSLARVPEHDPVLQNRTDAFSRRGWLEDKTTNYNPDMAQNPEQSTPTMGAPTFWRRPTDNVRLATSGIGRLLVIKMLMERAAKGDANARLHLQAHQAEVAAYSKALELGTPGPRDVVVLELNTDYETAVTFAKNSQDTNTERLSQMEKAASHADLVRAGDHAVPLDPATLPDELDDSTVLQYVQANPTAFESALAAVMPNATERASWAEKDPSDYLAAVKGVLLGQINPETQAAVARYGSDALDRLAVAAPALVALNTITEGRADLDAFRVGDYYLDALELWQGAVNAKSTSPERMAAHALDMANQLPVMGGKPLAVSKVSLALAMVMAQKSTAGGVFRVIREMGKAAASATTNQVGLFRKAPDVPGEALRVLTGATGNAGVIPSELPDTHTQAAEYARDLEMRAIEARRSNDPNLVTEPPGFEAVKDVAPGVGNEKPERLYQHTDYTTAAANAAAGTTPADRELRTSDTSKDKEPAFRGAFVFWKGNVPDVAALRAAEAAAAGAEATVLGEWATRLADLQAKKAKSKSTKATTALDDFNKVLNAAMPAVTDIDAMHAAAKRLGAEIAGKEVNAYGVMAATMRAKSLLTREQLNMALGYKADNRVYDAVDLESRVLAHAAVSFLQGREMPTRYVRPGNRISVPVTRVAAVRARALAVLGDLPAAVRDSIYAVDEAPTQANPNGVVTRGPDSSKTEVVRLNEVEAHRILALLAYMEDTGFQDSLTLPVRRLTLEDLVRGSRYDGRTGLVVGTDFTTEMWGQIVGAVMDSQSGVAPFRGKAERHALASALVWYVAQRASEYDVVPQDAGFTHRALASLRSMTSGFVLDWLARPLLSSEQYAPDMPEYVRPLFEKYTRTVGRLPGDLVEAVKETLRTMPATSVGKDGAFLAALRSLAASMHGLDGPISIVRNSATGISDLDEMRGWLRVQVDVAGNHVVNTPYQPPPVGQSFLPHDLDRSGMSPVTDVVGEVTRHARLVERVARRQGTLDAPTLECITALRAGTLDEQQAAFLLNKMHAALHNAEQIGLDVITAAAGQSGDVDRIRNIADEANYKGTGLDAYESFYSGRWGQSDKPGYDRSIQTIVNGIYKKAPVDTHAWVFEVMNNLRVRWATERFWNELVDHGYAVDLNELWRMGHRDGPLPDLATRAVFSNRVAHAATMILMGQDTRTSGGFDAAGRFIPGAGGSSGVTEVERAVAHSLIARMGMRPDLASSRKAMKGSVVPNAVTNTFASQFDASVTPDERARSLASGRAANQTGLAAQSPEAGTTLAGADYMMYAPLLERAREMVREQGPVGQNIAGILKDREKLRKFVESAQEYGRQYKGQLISGGPNGIAAAALAAAAWTGGASLPAAALAGAAGLVWSFVPRLPAYATNALGAVLQGYTEYGARWMTRFAGEDLIKRKGARATALALQATRHSIVMDRMIAPLDYARRAASAVLNRVAGRASDSTAFVDANGRVHTVGSLIAFGEANGLDGTQAKFESAEKSRHAMDRLAREYGPTTPMGKVYNAVAAFFGRHALAENYRKVYEANDTFFRYSYFIRGVMDGETPQDSLKRALNATFDYSASAPIDRWISSAFLFWMFQRRTVDMTIRALVLNPHRVLGPLRFLRDQDLASGYVEENEDHVPVAEQVPDYMQARYAIAYLPIYGSPNSVAAKVGLQEALTVNAMRALNDFSSLDATAMMGRMRPEVQLGFNLVNSGMGNEWVSFFKKGTVDESSYFDVPLWFVRADQQMYGGAFGKRFGWFPVQTDDPSRWISPDYPYTFRIPPQNYAAWELFRNVAGISTIFGNGDIDARTGGWISDVNETAFDFIGTLDPATREQYRVSVGTTVDQGGSLIPAAVTQPRDFLGARGESLRNMGAGIGVIRSPLAVDADRRRAVDAAAAAKLAQQKKEALPVPEVEKIVGPDTVEPGAKMGLEPGAPSGFYKK